MPDEKFANIAFITVTESASNTLTFKKLETGIAPFEKVAFLINRLEYFFSDTVATFAAANDILELGLSASDQFTDPKISNSAIIDYNEIMRVDVGTAASGWYRHQPYIKDYSTLPGNGILVAPNPLYLWAMGTSLGNATIDSVRMFYTVKQLKQDEFWELIEMRRMIGT